MARPDAAEAEDLPMSTPLRPKAVAPPAVKLGEFFKTSDEIEEGVPAELELHKGGEVVGVLPIRVMQGKTQRFFKVLSWATRAVKHGLRPGGGLKKTTPVAWTELDIAQSAEVATITLARASWVSFDGEIEMPDGEVLTNSPESRERILRTFPDFETQVARLCKIESDNFAEGTEDLGEP